LPSLAVPEDADPPDRILVGNYVGSMGASTSTWDFRTVTPHSGHAINKERAGSDSCCPCRITSKDGVVPRLELVLVTGLLTSPPVFEYEPGELSGLIIGAYRLALAGWRSSRLKD